MGIRCPLGVIKKFQSEIELAIAQHWKYTKCHRIVIANVSLCEFCLTTK